MGEPATENVVTPENQEPETSELLQKKAPRKPHQYEDECVTVKLSAKKRKLKGTLLARNNPSYCLKRGIGSLDLGGESLRSQHREGLWKLLKKLIRHHNLEEAAGVLSILLQGTVKDQSPSQNRTKYWAALEVLDYIKNGVVSSRKIQSIYELWMKKIGPLKNWSTKNRFAVQLEFIISCLQRGSTEDAYQAALCLMQERGFDSDPIANLVVGLAFSQLWYSSIPKELKLTELDSSSTSLQSEIPIGDIHMSIDNSKENDAVEARETNSLTQDYSNSSVNDKEAYDEDQHQESMDIDGNLRKESSPLNFQPQESYINSAGGSGYYDNPFLNHGDHLPHASIFTRSLPPWLLPLKLPSSHETLEDARFMHKNLHHDYYKNALKHLRVALYSTPPVMEAFHPLIQMLLLGDQIHEALGELDNFLNSSHAVHLRLGASLLENFDSGNYTKLSACFEDILKKDPTCSRSLSRLVFMHQRGDYDTQNLVGMIALHLDATYGTHDTWKELASCFLKLSQAEEDRASACFDGNNGCSQEYLDSLNKIPELFTKDESGKSWRFRCRWWLNRHFRYNILTSDVASGDLQLLTYKAATAAHLYGRHFKYVLKATECLEKENNMELYSFLQMHILNSVGFYSIQRSS